MKIKIICNAFLSLALSGFVSVTSSAQAVNLDGKTYTVKVDIQKPETTTTTVNDEIIFAGGTIKATFSANLNFPGATYVAANGGTTSRPTITFTATSTGPTGNLVWSGTISDTYISGTATRTDDRTSYSFSGNLKTASKITRTK